MFSTRLQLAATSGTALRNLATWSSSRARTSGGSSTAQNTRHVIGVVFMERTVGAALRGRPRLKHTEFKNRQPRVLRTRFQPRAATEGRPYSTFHGSFLRF